MGLGFFYNGRNQPEMGEKFFRRALQDIDVEKEPVAVFNAYLSLAQSLSFKRPAEAMSCLDSLPQQMLANPMYESGVLGYRCIIANKMGDREAFYRYFAKYDSIRLNLPAQFNAANLQQVMVCHSLMQNDYQRATAFKTEVADDVTVCVNPLLQDLLNCLLDNADKYATDGSVLVSCHANADGTYAISITNEGPVIPAADAERIFEPFVRLSPDEHSLGIGLPLARRLAISMGYNVTIDLEYTSGARFVVSGI